MGSDNGDKRGQLVIVVGGIDVPFVYLGQILKKLEGNMLIRRLNSLYLMFQTRVRYELKMEKEMKRFFL